MSGKEFSDWVTGKTAAPYPDWPVKFPPIKRLCRGQKGCATQTKFTYVDIVAAGDANKLDLDNFTNDRVVAKMTVLKQGGGRAPDERRYALSGDDFVYYLVVQPPADPGPVARWALVEVDDDGYHQAVGWGVFKRCCDPTKPDPSHCTPSLQYSYASFGECGQDHRRYINLVTQLMDPTKSAQRAAVQQELASLGDIQGPAWVTCAHGCCIAGGY
jgi:hypothetical protein